MTELNDKRAEIIRAVDQMLMSYQVGDEVTVQLSQPVDVGDGAMLIERLTIQRTRHTTAT
jgi:hypothetical protein